MNLIIKTHCYLRIVSTDLLYYRNIIITLLNRVISLLSLFISYQIDLRTKILDETQILINDFSFFCTS